MENPNPSGGRSGSIIAVIIVSVILGTLAAGALVMSSGYRRQSSHEGLRFSAHVAAKAAAEEAALLIHNGKLDIVIDDALASQQTKDLSLFLSDRVHDENTRINGIVGGRPKVSVTAAVANPQGWAQTPLQQWEAIIKEVTDAKNSEAIAFWQEMRDKNLIGTAPPSSSTFMDRCSKVNLDRIVGNHTQNQVPNSNPTQYSSCKCLDGAHELAQLFGTVTTGPDNKVSTSWSGNGPDVGALKSAWNRVVTAVAKDAASKVESCGSNPAGAMAHLMGDLYNNEVVSSGTERDAAKAFLESEDVGVTSTYLLEITAEVGYGAGPSGTDRSGKARYSTYRLFQKAPWEKGVDAMQKSVVRCLLSGCGKHKAYSRRDIEQLWPAPPEDPADPARSAMHRAKIPEKTQEPSVRDTDSSDRYYDPTQVIAATVDEVLPASVGSRLFPYTLCSTTNRAP